MSAKKNTKKRTKKALEIVPNASPVDILRDVDNGISNTLASTEKRMEYILNYNLKVQEIESKERIEFERLGTDRHKHWLKCIVIVIVALFSSAKIISYTAKWWGI